MGKYRFSPRCDFCFIAEDTINHLFCACHRTITLYLQIKELLAKCDINIPDTNVYYILIGVQPMITMGRHNKEYSYLKHFAI